ncbi:hypothetical protein ACFWDA_06965 [Rhodococcus zopfii]|uniref:hypothetical protein n=1 Tax=Rhodococcus zopfii TaxID=43772 RepID=UPI003529381F
MTDRGGLAQDGFEALEELDQVVAGEPGHVVAEQAVDDRVEGGQPRLEDLSTGTARTHVRTIAGGHSGRV